MIEVPTLRPVSTPRWLLVVITLAKILIAIYFFTILLPKVTGELAGNRAATALAQTAQATATLAASATLPPTVTPRPSVTSLPTATATATFTPTATATPKAGARRTSKKDGMVRVYIPAGSLHMGRSGNGEADQPRHLVFLDAYWISRTQVTNAMYAKCVRAGGCTNPIRKEINPHYFDLAYADHPAVYINWEQAQAYCKWSGGSLPTEAEWERAAAGDGRREFPWGNDDPGPEQANVNNPAGSTSAVGSYPDGASPFGVLDMGSNVREWVKGWFNSSY